MGHKVGWGPRIDAGFRPQKSAGKTDFKRGEKTKVGVNEASDVVSLGQGRFLVVGDQSDKMGLVDADGNTTKVKLPGLDGKVSELEGVAYDPARQLLFVSREEDRKVVRYSWSPDSGQAPVLQKTFDLDLGGPKNKGVEGLVFLPGEFSPSGRPQLLAVKEGKPRELLMMDDNGSSKTTKVDLEQQVLDVCKDFSAITVDPKSGHLFISSDASSTVAELELRRKGDGFQGRLVQSFPLRDKHDDPMLRVEGLAFDEHGNLHVLQENTRELTRFERK